MARELGRRGGQARAERLSAERRREAAALGGPARQRSLLATQRLVGDLPYAAAAAELRGEASKVLRGNSFAGRLPGLDPGGRRR